MPCVRQGSFKKKPSRPAGVRANGWKRPRASAYLGTVTSTWK
ncbi:hypothetical protein Y024_5884 [Burkholderia pseudomallei TSV44]|nr:hypothetical protein Y024_5884 [Burkholderia pseudomallei TSV44]